MSEANTHTAKNPPRRALATAPPEARPLPWRPNARTSSILALIAADVLTWGVATAILYFVRTLIWGTIPFHWVFWVEGAVWIIFRAAVGLYSPYGISQPEELRRSFHTAMGAAVTHMAMLFALQEFAGWRLMGLGVWLLVIPLAWFSRSLVRLLLIHEQLFGNPYVVIGTGAKARSAIKEMQANPELGMFPVAAFGDDPERWGGQIEGVPVLGPIDAAEEYSFPYRVTRTMVALSRREASADRLLEVTSRLTRRYPTINIFPNFAGTANLWAQPRPLGPYLVLETRHARFSARQRFLKRSFDLAVGLPMFLLAAPIIGVAALLVKIFSPGPAFFSQTREGISGEPIKIWKIRSMVPDAERRLAEYLASNPAARFEWERTLKLRNDPRIIPGIGNFIRKFSIDELPQLWNVIKGDLSLVGPRVMPDHEVNRYSGLGAELRRDVPPGLTGYWQIFYRSNSDLHIREVADGYYVSNWSIWLDLWIMLRTIRVVLVGSGAY